MITKALQRLRKQLTRLVVSEPKKPTKLILHWEPIGISYTELWELQDGNWVFVNILDIKVNEGCFDDEAVKSRRNDLVQSALSKELNEVRHDIN